MRLHSTHPLCIVAIFGFATSACSMLGSYANGASSMLTQPSTAAAMAGEDPVSSTPTGQGTPESKQPEAKEAKAASEPTTVSVTLVNGCSDSVKVFFGDKPKFGSGRYSSLSGNSRLNQSFRPGDQIWIVDDGQNGIANAKIQAGMREVQVTSSCNSLQTR